MNYIDRMKRITNLLGIALLMVTSMSMRAQEADTALATVAGRVVTTEGERMEFPTIFLPEYTDPALLASGTSGYHDSLVLFDSNDILYIEIWHPDMPVRVHRLYSVRLKRPDRKVAHYWAVMDIRTPYGFTVMSYPRYRITADGELRKIPLYGNRDFSRPRIFALHYGKEYYDHWPLNTDSKILWYLNRDDDSSHGSVSIDTDHYFDTGFDADDFFGISDIEFGL